MKKVLITGIGMVTAVGNGKTATWEAVKAGRPGIGRITKFDPSRCTSQVAAEVKGFDEYALGAGLIDKKAMRHMALFSQYAVASANEAWKDAGYTAENKPDMDRVGTIFGIGIGGLDVTGESFKTLSSAGRSGCRRWRSPNSSPTRARATSRSRWARRGPARSSRRRARARPTRWASRWTSSARAVRTWWSRAAPRRRSWNSPSAAS